LFFLQSRLLHFILLFFPPEEIWRWIGVRWWKKKEEEEREEEEEEEKEEKEEK
jgi:hypothetical protein